MAAVDKLHKLYSTTFEPIVWARSVGLEVINEFDSVKAAIMMSAGAQSKLSTGSSGNVSAFGWNLAADSVETLSGGIKTAKVIGESLMGVAGSSLWRFSNPGRSQD